MAEAILRRRLSERGLVAEVGSAGFLPGGAPATEPAVEVMAGDGYDLSAHVSRQLTDELVAGADLIIAMTRQHVIDLALEAPESWPHTYQLVDLVRRGEQTGPWMEGVSFDTWLAAVGEGRTRAGLLASSLSDDVADPVGQPMTVHRRSKSQLDDLLSRLAALL